MGAPEPSVAFLLEERVFQAAVIIHDNHGADGRMGSNNLSVSTLRVESEYTSSVGRKYLGPGSLQKYLFSMS